MEVEIIHRDDLAVATARCAAFDAKRWSLTRLANTGEHTFAEMCTQRLTQPDGGCTLAFAQRRRIDAGDDEQLAIGDRRKAIADDKKAKGK